eukprot:gene13145-3468_t
MEFEHLEKNLGRQAEGMDLEASPASLILVVTAAEVIAAGAKLSTWRVLYVGHPVNVSNACLGTCSMSATLSM